MGVKHQANDDRAPRANGARSAQRAALLLGLMLWLSSWAASAAETARVAVTEAEQRPWQQTLPLYGTLTSPRDAVLTPRVAGLVDDVHVSAGDRVAAGDVLVTLDRALDERRLSSLEAQAAQAEARLAEARRLLAESRDLARQNAVAQTELESRQAEVAAQRAAYARLAADIARQREVLDRHRVIAPFAGVVRARLVEPGEYVAQSMPAVALVKVDRLRLDVAAPQQYFPLINAGMAVRLRPDALPETTLEARVDVIVPASDAAARSFLVRTLIDNRDGALTPGMSAKVLFDIQSREPVTVVPRDALVRIPGGGVRVWVAEQRDGARRAVKRQVSLGRGANGVVEVRAGVRPGEAVIVRGNENLEAGQPVQVVERAGAPRQTRAGPKTSLRLSDDAPR